MTTMALTFDTLKYANRLKAAGLEPKIAEAQAEAEAEIFAEALDNQLATKQDIKDLRSEVQVIDSKVDRLRSELTIKLGGIMVAGIGLIATLLVIFHAAG
ncbi:MAG: DUF1640 domain-containing protein [Gammaproteobacteria bacterium]|nr:DUF1640 domain-containing protein [Gammaproteobacteria bacterium]